MAISEDDRKLIQNFHNELSKVTMDECGSCREKWFGMDVKDGICGRCSEVKRAERFCGLNHMDPGPSIQQLARDNGMKVPEVLSQVEEMMISPVITLPFSTTTS